MKKRRTPSYMGGSKLDFDLQRFSMVCDSITIDFFNDLTVNAQL